LPGAFASAANRTASRVSAGITAIPVMLCNRYEPSPPAGLVNAPTAANTNCSANATSSTLLAMT
jgi:hypothetical protein